MSIKIQNTIVIVAGAVCFLSYVLLMQRSSEYGTATLFDLSLSAIICLVATLVIFILAWRKVIQLRAWHIVIFAILFRVVGASGYPVLEDDHFRYLFDGWLTVENGTPYGIAPNTLFSTDAAGSLNSNNTADTLANFELIDDAIDGINYPGLPTVYGPTAQWIFAAAYLLAPAEVWPLQLFCSIADILIVLMLLRLSTAESRCWLLLYAWSPLLIKEFSFSAHIDVIGVCFLLFAWLLVKRMGNNSANSMVNILLTGVLIACAAGIKPFALIVAPFILGRYWLGYCSLAFSMAILAWPFGMLAAWMPDGLTAMADQWLFNAPLYLLWITWAPPDMISGGLQVIKGLALLCFALVWGGVVIKWLWPNLNLVIALEGALMRCLGKQASISLPSNPSVWLMFLFLLILPVLNPWYIVWALPFAVLRPELRSSWALWMASATFLLSYATGLNLGHPQIGLYGLPGWVVVLEFSLIFWAGYFRDSMFRPFAGDAKRSGEV